jgi:hypothetical protein
MRFRAGLACILWIPVAWTPLFAAANASEPGGNAAKTTVRESIKFDPNDLAVFLPVRVGTKDYQFVLDTGAPVNVFDVSLRSCLGPRVRSVRVAVPLHGDNVELELYSAPNARVGSLPLTKNPVYCHDLTPFREVSGCSVHGIVGVGFLENWIITIDFDKGHLDVLSPETAATSDWGEGMPFVWDAIGFMCILATVGKDDCIPFRVDTGCASTGMLDDTLLSRLVSSSEARVTGDEKALDLSGTHSSSVARLSHLSLGSFRHENLRFTSGKLNILGLYYLSRYRVTIDFPHGRLYLAKGKRFAGPDPGDNCGLRYFFRAGGLQVESVDERSPARTADVRAKDVIVKLNGKPVSDWKSSEIRRLLTTEGKTVQMTVKRDGKLMEMPLTPKEYD